MPNGPWLRAQPPDKVSVGPRLVRPGSVEFTPRTQPDGLWLAFLSRVGEPAHADRADAFPPHHLSRHAHRKSAWFARRPQLRRIVDVRERQTEVPLLELPKDLLLQASRCLSFGAAPPGDEQLFGVVELP